MYWLTGILGFVLAVAPFVLQYSNNVVALWTSLLVGGATILISGIEWLRSDKEVWEYWVVAVLGFVAIVAPFVFGFGGHATAMWTSVILGILITLFAGSRLTVSQ